MRAETEGKNVTQHIMSLQIKNWHFRPADAKVLSACIEKHDRIESIQFVKTKINADAINELVLPSSVKFIWIHSNDMNEPGLIEALINKEQLKQFCYYQNEFKSG